MHPTVTLAGKFSVATTLATLESVTVTESGITTGDPDEIFTLSVRIPGGAEDNSKRARKLVPLAIWTTLFAARLGRPGASSTTPLASVRPGPVIIRSASPLFPILVGLTLTKGDEPMTTDPTPPLAEPAPPPTASTRLVSR